MFLSIIVPVYNVESYLSECLDSLIEQDIPESDYEIICVNDGATDSSRTILQQYKEICGNLSIVDKDNGGLSSARNAGLDVAKGDYIWFVDSDDFVQPNILSKLKERIKSTDCDRLIFENTYEFQNALTEQELLDKQSSRLKANHKYGDGVAWSSIIRHQLIEDRQLRFHRDIPCYGEDLMFNYQMNMLPYRKEKIDCLVYYYRRRSGSIMTSNTTTADLKRISVGLKGAAIMREYYLEQTSEKCVQENNNSVSDTANLIMFFLRPAMLAIARMPRKEAKGFIKQFRNAGLFPLKMPPECTVRTSRMTNRSDIIGKVYDQICLHITYRWGYVCMRIWNSMKRR